MRVLLTGGAGSIGSHHVRTVLSGGLSDVGGCELSDRELTGLLLEATGRGWGLVEPIPDPRGGGHDRRCPLDWSRTAVAGSAAGPA